MTTIPRETVFVLKLSGGDTVEFYKNNGDVIFRKAKK